MGTSCDVSIVIPAYNEESRLGPTLDRILAFLLHEGREAEVIVVDGDSRDRTPDIVQEHVEDYARQHQTLRLLRNPANRGKGYCVRRGVMEARGKAILFTDADLSAPIEESVKLFRALDAGADVAIGSRWMQNDLQTRRQSLARQVMGRAFNRWLRLVLGLDFDDTQCGFKAFRGDAARAIFSQQKIERWGFDPEILFLARQSGFKVAEVPVLWAHDCRTTINPVLDGSRMVAEIVRIRWHFLRGEYGARGLGGGEHGEEKQGDGFGISSPAIAKSRPSAANVLPSEGGD